MNRIDWWHVATAIAYGISAIVVAFGLWALCVLFLASQSRP